MSLNPPTVVRILLHRLPHEARRSGDCFLAFSQSPVFGYLNMLSYMGNRCLGLHPIGAAYRSWWLCLQTDCAFAAPISNICLASQPAGLLFLQHNLQTRIS